MKWTEEKNEILLEYYPKSDWETIYEKLECNNKAKIQSQASKLKIKREYSDTKLTKNNNVVKGAYSNAEIEFIKDNYVDLGTKVCSNHLNRSYNSVCNMVAKLNADGHRLHREKWTSDDISLLKNVYPLYPNEYIVDKYFQKKNVRNLSAMAQKLNIIKNKPNAQEQFVRSDLLNRLKLLSIRLGRAPTLADMSVDISTPSEATYRRYFGSFSKALLLIDETPNRVCFGRSIVCVSTNGDICDSNSEYIVTQYFIENNIPYEKCVRYSKYINDVRCSTKTCDWISNGVFVEFFGLDDKPYYAKKMNEKINICRDNGVTLISLFRKDLKNLKNKLNALSQ